MLMVEMVTRFVMPDYIYDGGMSLSRWAVATTLVVGLSIVMAHLSWHRLEKPILERVRNGRLVPARSLA